MIDIQMTTSGDLVIGPDGDFAIVQNDEAIQQAIMFRLKTTRGDWLLSPGVGADLEQFIGKRMDQRTLNSIKNAVSTELSKIQGVPGIEVNVAPKDENTVWILVEFNSIELPSREISLIFDLDTKTGQVNARK